MLKKHLFEKEITVITGPRQAGKTTLMNMLMKDLSSGEESFVYLNLDKEKDMQVFQSQEGLLAYLRLQLGTKKKSFVFVDEIQRKENAGMFLKGIYDSDLPYKFVVSGSGSVELKEKISEGLAGRKKTFKLKTISFGEFVNYRTEYKYESNLDDYFSSPVYSDSLLDEYLQFGGYPKLILKETSDDKKDVLESVFESYVDKDLRDLLGLKKTGLVADLLTFLSTRVGKLTPRSEISSRVGISYDVVGQYLYFLEKTFQINLVRPFSGNSENEIVKTPLYYFSDLGMRNFVFNRLSHYDRLVSGPMLFQNFVYLLLSADPLVSKVSFWRTKDQAEVDFIAHIGSVKIPVEVKFSSVGKNFSLNRSVYSYIKKYSPEKFFLVNLDTFGELKVDKTQIKLIPFYYLINHSLMETGIHN